MRRRATEVTGPRIDGCCVAVALGRRRLYTWIWGSTRSEGDKTVWLSYAFQAIQTQAVIYTVVYKLANGLRMACAAAGRTNGHGR